MMPESRGASDPKCGDLGSELGPELPARSVDDGGDRGFDLLVRQGPVGRPELERERQALRPLGERPASEDVEERRTVQDVPPAASTTPRICPAGTSSGTMKARSRRTGGNRGTS